MPAADPTKRRQSDPEPSRQRILDAALRLFAQHGYEGVSLQQIADAVGLHKATLFHYFDGKQELAQEVWTLVIRPLLSEMEALDLAPEAAPRLEQVIGIAERLVDHFAEQPFAARLLLRAMIAPGDAPFQADPADAPHAVERILTILWNWVDRARRTGVIRHVNLRLTIFNMLGVILFYPAASQGLPEIAGDDPFSLTARRAWKREIGDFIRGALARPTSGA